MTRRSELASGRVLTAQVRAQVSGESCALQGLVSMTGKASDAARWWPWVSFRQVGSGLLMLTCSGVGGKATWVPVATVTGDQVTWRGLMTYSSDDITALRQGMRERLMVCSLRSLGMAVDSPFGDAWDDDTMSILGEIRCAVCGGALTSARSIQAGVGPSCSGVEQAGRDRTEAKRERAKGLTIEEMRARIQGK